MKDFEIPKILGKNNKNYLKLGREHRFGVLNPGSLFSRPPTSTPPPTLIFPGEGKVNFLGCWVLEERGDSARLTQDWRPRDKGVLLPAPFGVLDMVWVIKKTSGLKMVLEKKFSKMKIERRKEGKNLQYKFNIWKC